MEVLQIELLMYSKISTGYGKKPTYLSHLPPLKTQEKWLMIDEDYIYYELNNL